MVVGSIYDGSCFNSGLCTDLPTGTTNSDYDQGTEYMAKQIVINKEYDFDTYGYYKNDYCLIETETEIQFGSKVKSIPIPGTR